MKITIDGVGALMIRFGKARAITQYLEPPMQRAVLRAVRTISPYPPAPPNSRYRRGQDPRSEHLGKKWTKEVKITANGITGKVGNTASYAPLVQSSRFQTRVHRRTGWKTDRQTMEELRPVIVADFQQTIAAALR